MPSTIIVVRHANTFEDKDLPTRIGTRTDLSLTQGGLEQAAQIGQFLKIKGYLPAAVYSSFMTRSRQTAQAILKEMRLEREIQLVRMLNEIDYGPDENQPENVVLERMGGSAALDEWNRHGILPPEWQADIAAIKQHWIDFGHQMDLDHPGKAVLVVTHSGVGRFSLALTGDFAKAARNYGLKMSMGGISIFEKNKISDPWQVKEWNARPKSGTSSMSSRRF